MCTRRVSAHLLLLAALPALAGRGWWCADGEVVSVTSGAGAGAGPEFLPAETTLVAAVGQDAVLDCRVRNLADKAVLWVRSGALQILSHGGAVFTADARVSVRAVAAAAGASQHSLRIRRLRAADAGRYECQVNTDPKMSLFYNLTVLDEPVPTMVISAAASMVHAARGGAVSLRCAARYEPRPRALPLPPLDIRWTKDGEPVETQRGRGGVSRDTERWTWRAASRLTLAELAPTDAGLYACIATNTNANSNTAASTAVDYVHLYVDSESQMEAMQRDQSSDNSGARAAPRRARAVARYFLVLLLYKLLEN